MYSTSTLDMPVPKKDELLTCLIINAHLQLVPGNTWHMWVSCPIKQLSFVVVDMYQVVVSILDTANSSYLAPFNVLSQRIKEGSVEANNNLKFLESITTPCQNVRQLQPEAVLGSKQLPVRAGTRAYDRLLGFARTWATGSVAWRRKYTDKTHTALRQFRKF